MALRIGVLTVSDRVSAGEMEDAGGPAVEDACRAAGWQVAERGAVPDDAERIATALEIWCDRGELDVVFTTGGTGLGPRDVTPEATLRIASRVVPGIGEAIRHTSLAQTPMAILSRVTAVIRGRTLIVNLPGSPKGAVEGVEVVRPVLEHAVATMRGAKH